MLFNLYKYNIDLYDSIYNLPIYNWLRVKQTNDLRFLQKNSESKIKAAKLNVAKDRWQEIEREFVDTFGFSDEFKEIVSLEKEITRLKNLLIQNNDNSYITFIEIAEFQLKKLKNDPEKKTIDITKVQIERRLGYHLDAKKVTVSEYYTYIMELKNEQRNGKADKV